MKKIYIAGPMRGIPQFNFPAFDRAAKLLSVDWDVISPAQLDRDAGFEPDHMPLDWDWNILPGHFGLLDAIDRDLSAVKGSDAIYMLDGWQSSKGARAEKALAEWLGLEVIYQTKNIEGTTTTNEHGGKQSYVSAMFSAIPPIALRLLAQCVGFGARKYGLGNWKKISVNENICHAMNHLNEWNLGDRSEPHLVNALTRISFAVQLLAESGEIGSHYVHPDQLEK